MKFVTTAALAALTLACTANGVAAQAIPHSPILDLKSAADMRSEVDKRYQAALAATLSRDVVAKNDPRYSWASEAKAACGIALGYLKTRTVDAESINKCDAFAKQMTVIPPPPRVDPPRNPPPVLPPRRPTPPPTPTPPAAPTAEVCSIASPVKVYFDFNADAPSSEAREVVGKFVQGMGPCGWNGVSITGHADRSGSNAYNQGLSQRRARNVAGLFTGAGLAASALSVEAKGETMPAVPTPDGVREPLNRRVEVTATSRK